MEFFELSKNLRNQVYEGGDELITLIEDLVFSIKYPIIKNKISTDQKLIIKKLAEELIELSELSNNSIIKLYNLEEEDFE